MYYLMLLVGVFAFLSLLALSFPAQPGEGALAPWPPRRDKEGGAGVADFAVRFFGARTEDKPCLTPIECVQSGRCAGNCGWR